MSNRIERVLVSLLCAAIVATAGCTTTIHKSIPREKTPEVGETMPDGSVVVRNVTYDVPEARRSNNSWKCKVARVLQAGVAIAANPSLAAVFVADAVNSDK